MAGLTATACSPRRCLGKGERSRRPACGRCAREERHSEPGGDQRACRLTSIWSVRGEVTSARACGDLRRIFCIKPVGHAASAIDAGRPRSQGSMHASPLAASGQSGLFFLGWRLLTQIRPVFRKLLGEQAVDRHAVACCVRPSSADRGSSFYGAPQIRFGQGQEGVRGQGQSVCLREA